MLLIVAVVLAYLLGSVSFAIVVSRAMGLADPRQYGSGNPGATNVLRSGNKLAAGLTLAGDACKGAVAVALARWLFPEQTGGLMLICAVAVAVFVGHLWPLFFRFKGGKGVATALGVLLALNPLLGLACLGTWLLVAYLTRISSLAALTAACFAPLYTALLTREPRHVVTVAVIGLLLIWRHQRNIVGLMRGTESRIGAAKQDKPAQ